MKKTLEQKRENETKVVLLMINLYCRGNHGTKNGQLCDECNELAEYVKLRVEKCPHMETKTFCSSCKTHCYKPDMREKIKAVMRYSGPRMILHHPWLAIKHLVDTKLKKYTTRVVSLL